MLGIGDVLQRQRVVTIKKIRVLVTKPQPETSRIRGARIVKTDTVLGGMFVDNLEDGVYLTISRTGLQRHLSLLGRGLVRDLQAARNFQRIGRPSHSQTGQAIAYVPLIIVFIALHFDAGQTGLYHFQPDFSALQFLLRQSDLNGPISEILIGCLQRFQRALHVREIFLPAGISPQRPAYRVGFQQGIALDPVTPDIEPQCCGFRRLLGYGLHRRSRRLDEYRRRPHFHVGDWRRPGSIPGRIRLVGS